MSEEPRQLSSSKKAANKNKMYKYVEAHPKLDDVLLFILAIVILGVAGMTLLIMYTGTEILKVLY